MSHIKLPDSCSSSQVVFLTPEGGARLAQVGGAKVLPGVTFTAKTVLDVCVYLEVSRTAFKSIMFV